MQGVSVEVKGTRGYAATCATCAAADICRHTFRNGAYEAKSHGGKGCNAPITVTPDHLRAMRMAKADETKADSGNLQSASSPQTTQSTLWHKYIVTHRLKEYASVAHSPEQAVNFVRFKLYGARLADTLPPFTVRAADGETTRTSDRTGANGRLSLDAIRARLTRLTS